MGDGWLIVYLTNNQYYNISIKMIGINWRLEVEMEIFCLGSYT